MRSERHDKKRRRLDLEIRSAIDAELRQIDQSRRSLRTFGVTVGTVFVLISGFVLWRHSWALNTPTYVLAGIGATLFVAGWLAPRVLRPFHRLWMGLALVLGFVMTRLILTVVFYLAVVPTGLILRMLGKDPLQRQLDKEAPTYWQPKTYDDPSPQRFERYY